MLHTEVTELAGKRVLVTGGTTGIGRAVGALLSSYGARIFTFGRNQKPLDEALDYIRAAGGEAEGVTGDLTDANDVRRIFAKADDVFGGVDVLVNNAALPADGIMQMDDAEWRYAIEANLVGQLACAREAAARMIAAGEGHIVFIGSMKGFEKRLEKAFATEVAELMSADPITVHTYEAADRVAKKIADHHHNHLPVVDEDERLAGMVTRADALAAVVDS